ncbi:MAG: peptide deformylase [Vampirovibrionales bacterium]
MTVLKILKYPHPILRIPCPDVIDFDQALQDLVADMVETMYHGTGAVGLAAPQVGQSVRVFVMDTNAFTTRDNLKVMVNPKIITASRNKTMREGCLSFPEYLANVKRSQRITVEAFDAFGVLQTFELKHLEAVCVQHEIDHLDGILMMDRIESLKTDWLRRQNTKDDAEDSND